MESSWLEKLKISQTYQILGKNSSDGLYYQLYKSYVGYGLQVVDENGKPIEANSSDFSGYERQLLQALERIEESHDFSIDWENPDQEILVHQYPYLIGLLRLCQEKLVDEEGNKITFSEKSIGLNLHLEEVGDQYTAWHQLSGVESNTKDFELLSEDFLLHEGQIYQIHSLGAGFSNLKLFDSKFDKDDLVLFLSVYASQIDNFSLQYSNYKLRFSPEPIESEACLVFEKVDSDRALYLRVGQSLPGISLDMMKNYPIVRYAQVNQLEQSITIRPIELENQLMLQSHIEKLLKKLRKGKNNQAFFREEDTFVIEEECAEEFVTQHLLSLLETYQVLGNEHLREYKLVSKTPKLTLRLDHGIDFLEGSAELQFDEESLNLFDVLRQYRKQRYVVLSNGSKAILEENYIKKLERIFKKKPKKDEVKVSFFDLPLVEDLLDPEQDKSPFKRSRKVFEGFGMLEKQRLALPPLKAILREYQQYGYKWLNYLHEQKLGGCLADDMGLGKTLQSIAMLAKVYEDDKCPMPSLVVGPRSLLQNWKKECEKFAPQLRTHIYYGPDRDWKKATEADVIITTYAVMRNDIEVIKEYDLYYAILDESQNIKNLETQTTRAALMLKAEHRLALSGTPIENNLSELYALFRFLNPGMFGTPTQFNADFGTPIQKYNDEDAAALLKKKIFPFVLRRKKQDVLKDLPDKVEQIIYVDMGREQKKLYEIRRSFYQTMVNSELAKKGIEQSQFLIFQALNELRQIATVPEQFSDGKIVSAKRELLIEQVSETLANGHKALIFVNFLAAIEIIGAELNALGIDFVSMSGATRNRQELVDRFQEDPNCRVFLMTLKTGGTGLNLTAASTVFLYDPWWNVAAEAQAIDRTHRIGQKNKVHAIRLIAADSIEEKIRLLQEKKQELFDQVIGADSAALKSMSEEDIDFILGK